jgi:UPF0755 protein
MKEFKQPFSKNELYIIAAFFGFVLSILIFTFFTPNYYEERGPRQFEVDKGATLSQVIDSLYAQDFIPSKTNMKIAAFIYGAGDRIKAGSYSIPNGMSYLDLIDLLTEGSPKEQKLVTIQEGIWQPELAGLLQRELGLDSNKIIQLSKDKNFIRSLGLKVDNLEGYLLPDTYYFFVDDKATDVLRRLKNEMDHLFDEKAEKQMSKLGMSKHEILTMASIIEAESNIASEFATISGVYYNRLDIGMRLQADPTIQYLIRDRKRNNRILYKDLEIKSPYNTYKNRGLPPSPINNPGRKAVEAALYPEDNEYLYFVAKGDGSHFFAKSYTEHRKNVRKYRQWRRSQQ